jgi:protein O-mannosyl-transferase
MHNPKFLNSVRVSILLALITLAVYVRALELEFINLDDPDYVTHNVPVLSGLTWWGAGWAFTHAHASNWHPLTWLSHMLDCQLFGLNPAGHHLINVLFHTGNAVLLFLWLQRTTRARWRSAFVAALFALHPLHVESVAWISERKDVLSAFFGLLCLRCYATYVSASDLNCQAQGTTQNLRFKDSPRDQVDRQLAATGQEPNDGSEGVSRSAPVADRERDGIGHPARWYLLALILFALGLMSKPVLVTWPCVMLLLDYWPLQRFEVRKFHPLQTSRRLVLEKIPFFVLSAAACIMTLSAQSGGGAVARLAQIPMDERISNALVSYVRYIGKLFWPSHLSVMYRLNGGWALWAVFLSGVAIVVVSILLLWQRRSKPYLLVGWGWYLGTLVPMSGLVQVGNQSMADRYTYLPAIGLFLMLAWGAADVLEKFLSRRALTAGVAVVLGACAVMTYFQLPNWRNSEALFRHAIAVDPQNFVAHDCLGAALANQGDLEAAEKSYRVALSLSPGYSTAWNNLGCALRGQHKYTEAIAAFQTALTLNPKMVVAYNNLGAVFFNENRTEEAINQFFEALHLDPLCFEARFNLANALASEKQFAQAEVQLREVLRSSPGSAAAHYQLGIVLLDQERLDQAEKEFRTTLALQPHLRSAHQALGEALAKKRLPEEAAREFLAAAHLAIETGHSPEALALLAKARDLALAAGQKGLAERAERQLGQLRSQDKLRP